MKLTNQPNQLKMKNKILFLLAFLCFLSINSKVSAQSQNVTITSKRNDDKSVDLYYEKKNPGTYTVRIELSNVNNCDITSYEKTIIGFSGNFVKLRPVDKSKGISYSMRYFTIMGEAKPRVDSLFLYTLPFKNGKKVKIFEAGNVGEKYFGQEKALNWKSYVVRTENPDTICSMRKGIVVLIKNEYDSNDTKDVQYTSKRNYVVVEHADGTYATYRGFKKNGIFVEIGETVNPQTELGIVALYDNNSYRTDFNVYYLFDNNFQSEKQSMNNYKSKYKFITPVFFTKEGNVTLESKKEYTSNVNELVVTQEFSRSEKKRYTKEHALSK